MAKKSQEKPKAQKETGRPTSYKDVYADQVKRLLYLKSDATDKEIAEFFNVCEKTLNNWKNKVPEFLQSIRAGKTPADAEVADSLFRRCIGAEWTEEVAFKVKCVEYSDGKKVSEREEIKVVPVKKSAPPDTQAISLWLRNRRRDTWTDKPEPAPTQATGETQPEYTLNPDEALPDAPIL